MFKDSLKIEDGEPLTVTGSMPFAGGPLNSYVLHSSVEMIKKIRANEISYGLVTGVSGMMTKQSFCVWGNKYKEGFFHSDVTKKVISKEYPFNLSSKLHGDGKIIGYTFFENNNQKKNPRKPIIAQKTNEKLIIAPHRIRQLAALRTRQLALQINENQ